MDKNIIYKIDILHAVCIDKLINRKFLKLLINRIKKFS